MKKTKTIIVACGNGVATSQAVAVKIKNMCEEENIPVEIIVTSINQVPIYLDQADVYVTIGQDDSQGGEIPTISGIAFLTGMGMEQEFEKIKAALKE